eukprot:2939151-Ditylum_brightwellii.AAC.1
MPQHVRDAKTLFYNMPLEADCCTGVSSDEEAREYFSKNGFTSVPEKIQSASKVRNIHDIINHDSSDSDDSSVFIPRGKKKETEKDNKGMGKRKYFYELNSSSSIESKKKKMKKSNTQIKTKEEINMSEKTKKDVEGLLMYKKQP